MLPNLESLGVQDRNNDGIPDYIHARIYIADDATPVELAAAANIAARLAFETTSIDLPIAFPVSNYEAGFGPSIVVGRAATQVSDPAAILLADVENAERFARTIGLANYAPADRLMTKAEDPRLADMFCSVRKIVLGPDVRSIAVIDLAARVALESTELRLPLVVVSGERTNELPPPNSILVGLSNPYVTQLIRDGAFSPPISPGDGCIAVAGQRFIAAGADRRGEAEALRHASLCMPYVWSYEKGQLSLSSIEESIRRYQPSGEPHSELIFEDSFELPWEVDDALRRLHEAVLPAVHRGDRVDVDLRLSEPAEIRRDVAERVHRLITECGGAPSVRVGSAHKQGFTWIDEELKAHLTNASVIRISFRELQCDSDSLDPQDRWLHELYPIDEVLARDLGIPTDNITFQRMPPSASHVYEVRAVDAHGDVVLNSTFDPSFVERPLFDLFPEYARARVATGWVRAAVNSSTVIDERVTTDYERFWDKYQSDILPRIRDYVLRLYSGSPRPECAPHFDELTVDVELSEPDFRIGVDEERISTLEALHEDIYFETLLFFDVLGRATCGKPLKYAGRIVPRIRPSRPGPGRARVRFSGYSLPRAAGRPFADKNPSITAVNVKAGTTGATSIEALCGAPFCWLIERPVANGGVKEFEPQSPVVSWDEPIGPERCEHLIGQLARFPAVRPFLAGKSWLGRPVWAMDVVSPVKGKYFSERKASATKPCLFITGRQHANEVSSTSHILRLVELLATDPACKVLLDRVNFLIQPITNPDGAALVDELHNITPGFMLHAGYLGALGVDVTDQQWSDVPHYPEARIRADLWRMWQPDIVLNPHGYPSHEWVQLFTGYTAWVRSKDAQARDWWIPRGWFMPGFDFVDDERYPAHRTAAHTLADRIASAIHGSLGPLNERMYRRYAKYMSCELEIHNGVLLQGMKTPSKPDPESFGFATRYPEVTFFEALSEAPDEVASGQWLETVAAAGLEFSMVHARYLAELPQSIKRTRVEEDGAVTLRIHRERLPLEL